VAESATGWLEQEIRQQRALITEAMRADTVKPFTKEQFESGMDMLQAFAATRASFVRCEVAKLTDTGNPAAGCQ
jgi:hypothetical protein